MVESAHADHCRTCVFRCDGVCDADPARALRAARAATRNQPFQDDASLAGHHRYLVAAICRITGRFDLAPDLAQDVFVKALSHVDRFRQDARLTTWLYAIARNRCYDFMKGQAALREVSEEAIDRAPPIVDNAALRQLEVEEARRIALGLMRDALLERMERRAYMLHYAAGVPIDRVTTGLHLRNPSGAKAHIVSARRKLERAVTRWKRRESLRPR